MLSISIPSLRATFFTNPLKATARKVVGTINEVRQKAVRNQESYYLYLSRDENRIWYEKATAEQDETLEDDSVREKQELQFPDSVRLANVWLRETGMSSEGKTTLWISKKGYMEQTAILLTDDFDNSLSVQCNPFTDPMTVTDEFPPN
jgi:hypothetical protein